MSAEGGGDCMISSFFLTFFFHNPPVFPPTSLFLSLSQSVFLVPTHPAGPGIGVSSELQQSSNRRRAHIGQTLDMAHWGKWAPLEDTGSWRDGCSPHQFLSVTHWTQLAENFGGMGRTGRRDGYPLSLLLELFLGSCLLPFSISQYTGLGG